ncbi:MAG: hypothetical protein GX800_07185 [Clostridiaceae bacterium]|nr:hypothetical protein [Clostridiaceae bacterium]
MPLTFDYSNNGIHYYRANISFDAKTVNDGLYQFILTAFDLSGKSKNSSIEYYVDNTPPLTPTSVTAVAGPKYVTLNWTYPSTEEVPYGFYLYYGTSPENMTWTTIYDNVRTFKIANLNPLTTYYFSVSTFDRAYNESERTTPITETPILDTQSPVITSVSPNNDSRMKNISLSISGTDNVGITGYDVSIAPFGSDEYSFLASCNGYFYYTNTDYNGKYTFKIVAKDASDNFSEPVYATYVLDIIPPQDITSLTAAAGAGGISLVWDKVLDIDISRYYLYRKTLGENDYTLYRYISPITSNEKMSYVDYDVTSGQEYFYKVNSYDDLYNISGFSNAVSAIAATYSATFTVTPNTEVKPGSVLNFHAEGLRPNEYVTGYIDDGQIITGYTDNNGVFDYNWSYVKNTTEGQHIIKLAASYSNVEVSANIDTVTQKLSPVGNVSAQPDVMKVTLTWDSLSGASYYNIYRKIDDGQMLLLVEKIYSRQYTDLSVEKNKTYTYCVAGVDKYGTVGEYSIEAIAIAVADMIVPEVVMFSSNRSGDILKLIASASDDVRLKDIRFKFKNNTDSEYTEITTIPFADNKLQASVTYEFDTSMLAVGTYTIVAEVFDGANNVSTPKQITMYISNELPAAPASINASAGQMRINLTWTKPADTVNENSLYKIYRKMDTGEYTLISSTNLTQYLDTAVSFGNSYMYKITAVDSYGRESSSIEMDTYITPLADTTNPVINGFLPMAGTKISKVVTLGVLANDNVGVAYIDIFVEDGNGNYIGVGRTNTGSITFDTSIAKKSGTLTFKAVAFDGAGNTFESSVSYTVDNVSPEKPMLEANGSELKVELRWSMPAIAEDFSKYNIYKGTSPDDIASFTKIADTVSSVYVDDANIQYAYYVTSVDMLGNESEPSNVVICQPGSAATPPIIISIEPKEGAAIRTEADIIVDAVDNVDVFKYEFSYQRLYEDPNTGKLQPDPSQEWTLLDEIGVTNSSMVTYKWDTRQVLMGEPVYPDGYYLVRVSAFDSSGNYSSRQETVKIANNPPVAPDGLRVDATQWGFLVSWKPVTSSDFRNYVIKRKINDGEYAVVEEYTTSNIYIERNANPQDRYYYQVAIENDLGNRGPFTQDYYELSPLPSGIIINSLPQTTKPVIINMTPAQGKRFNKNLNIEVQIKDEVKVSDVRLYYSRISDGSLGEIPADAVYTQFATIIDVPLVNVNTTTMDIFGTDLFVATYNYNTEALSEGLYAIKAVVRNMSEQPVEIVKKYFKDTNPPEPANNFMVDNPKTGKTLTLVWEAGADVLHYDIYRSTDENAEFSEYTKIETVRSNSYTDTDVDNNVAYYYHVITVDSAENESIPSLRESAVPTAESDLSVLDINSEKPTIILGRSNRIKATLTNFGYAKAQGIVTFYLYDNGNYVEIASTNIELSANTSGEAGIDWTPNIEVGSNVIIKAVVDTLAGTVDISTENNGFVKEGMKTNIPPVAV